MIPRDKVDEAVRELLSKSEEQIEYETAVAWGARALAAYELVMMQPQAAQQARVLLLADSLYHEALEHAALVHDGGGAVAALTQDVAPARAAARSRVLG